MDYEVPEDLMASPKNVNVPTVGSMAVKMDCRISFPQPDQEKITQRVKR